MAREADGLVSLAKHSFTSGEVSPKLYGRQDLAKYAGGCSILRNFFVEATGGATTRPGSQYIGAYGSAGQGRLIPFQFSPTIGQTYVLAFSALKIRIIKNPGTAAYPNSSNAGFVLSAGVPIEITTPYIEADLRSIHYLQIADVMWLSCKGYSRKKLQRLSDTSWTLSDVSISPGVGRPTISGVTISALPAGSTDPQKSRYMYAVSAVNADGDESHPSAPFISGAGINIATTQGTVTTFWGAITDAVFYKVYKALPMHGDKVPNQSEQFGFAGYAYGTVFTDSNIVADFAHPPIQANDPFAPSPIASYTITNSGANYPVGGTTVTVSDATGSGAIVYPILSTNDAGATGTIIGLFFSNFGRDYTAPTIAAAGGAGAGFTATLTLGHSTGVEPSVVGISQQRLVYGSTDNKPNSLFASRPGKTDDFRKSNPVVDNDAFEFAIFDQQVTRIYWFRSMPGGLLIGTDAGVLQLTGGSSSPTNPVAITPTNAVIVPQSFFGVADVPPIVIDYDVLFIQKEGLVRDLQYNFFANIYTGTDLTTLSGHLFENARVVEWAYQDSPNKILWCTLDSGIELSLTYLKAQEVLGWARQDTQGRYESICVVQEGTQNAIYRSVLRNNVRMIERMTTQNFYQDSDAWQLDSALSITSNYPVAALTLAAGSGTNVLVTADAAVFAPGDVGKAITAFYGKAVITSYVSTTQVRVNIEREFVAIAGSGTLAFPSQTWRMDSLVTTVTGLSHLNGFVVYALVDGEGQGPFTVAGGSVTLTTPGYQVVVGLFYLPQLQPLWIDVQGETSIQGKRKKVAAATIRVRNAKNLLYGPSFETVQPFVEGISSTDEPPSLPYPAVGMSTGDQRIWLDQVFDTAGWVCIQQNSPLPATVLAIYPEIALGDQ